MLSPLLYKLCDIVLKVLEDDTPSGKALKEAILTYLCRRHSSLNQQEVLHVVAFLDPFVLEMKRKDVQEAVKLEMLDLNKADYISNETWEEVDANIQSHDGLSPPKKAKPGSISYFFFGFK